MRRAGGFTLTELIMVIVILGIIASISVRFIQFSTQGAIDTANRQRLAMAAGIISEQLSRELRSALPGSVRTGEGGQCIEFFPVWAGSSYIDGEGSLTLNEELASFRALPFSRATDEADHVFVYPYAEASFPADLYSDGALTRAGLASVNDLGGGEVEVSLSGTHTFTAHSPRRRVLLAKGPVTYCQGENAQSRFLFRYRDYGRNSSATRETDGTREVAAMPLVPGSLEFTFLPPTQQRNGVVTFEFDLQSEDSEESLAVSQEVQIRNVP